MTLTPKLWWQSKMLWFNALTILGTVLGMVADLTFITPEVGQIVLILLAATNAALRLVTVQPLETKKETPDADPSLETFVRDSERPVVERRRVRRRKTDPRSE